MIFCWAQWYTPVIPVAQEAELEGSQVQSQPQQERDTKQLSETWSLNIGGWRCGSVECPRVQSQEPLPSKMIFQFKLISQMGNTVKCCSLIFPPSQNTFFSENGII